MNSKVAKHLEDFASKVPRAPIISDEAVAKLLIREAQSRSSSVLQSDYIFNGKVNRRGTCAQRPFLCSYLIGNILRTIYSQKTLIKFTWRTRFETSNLTIVARYFAFWI